MMASIRHSADRPRQAVEDPASGHCLAVDDYVRGFAAVFNRRYFTALPRHVGMQSQFAPGMIVEIESANGAIAIAAQVHAHLAVEACQMQPIPRAAGESIEEGRPIGPVAPRAIVALLGVAIDDQ